MTPGKDYHPYSESKLMEKSSSGAFTRFKEPEELTQQEAMTIFVLERELEKHEREDHLTPPQKAKIESELMKLREKERFKQNKEASQMYHIGDGWGTINGNKLRIQQLEKEMQSSGRQDPDKKQELQDLRDQEVPIDGEQFKVLLKDILEEIKHPELKKFVAENCIFDLNGKAQAELTVDPFTITDKITLTFNPKAFCDMSRTKVMDKFGVERHLKLFNPAKAAFLIGQALGYIFIEPDDWKEVAPKIQIVVGSEVESWADWVGLCISNPDKAEKLSPEAYKYFRKMLNGLKDKKINLKKEKKSFKSPIFAVDLRDGKDKNRGINKQEGSQKSFLNKFTKKLGFGSIDHEQLAISFSLLKKALWKKTDWYQRAIAENESKEVSRIKVRQEGIEDRDKSLRQLLNDGSENIGTGDQFMLRTILLADMEFDDWSNERMHFYLQACDDKYRQTHGEQIEAESYAFLVRLHRNSNAKGRMGTKPTEYKKVEIGEEYTEYNREKRIYERKRATKELYIRRSRESYQTAVLEEINTFTARKAANISKECMEYIKKRDGKFIEIDETWSENPESKSANRKYDNPQENKYMSPTGSLKGHLGVEFADRMLNNFNNRGPLPKLNVDQIALLARIMAEEIKFKMVPSMASTVLGREHAMGILVEAVHYYEPKFIANDQYREYINYFLRGIGKAIDSKGVVHDIESTKSSDQEILQDYIDGQKRNKDFDYDETDKILNEYDGCFQDEKPYWEKDENGKYKDTSNNQLKKRFILERNEQEIVGDVSKLEQSMDKYILKIAEMINKANLPVELKHNIRKIALLSNDVFILDDIRNHVSEYDTELLSSDEVYNTYKIIQDTVIGLRPYRRELLRIKELFGSLGLEYLGEQIRALPEYDEKYGVKVEGDKNFQRDEARVERLKESYRTREKLTLSKRIGVLSEEDRIKYLELKEKIEKKQDEIDDIAENPAEKKKLKGLNKELANLKTEINPFEEKIGRMSKTGVYVELQQDVQDIMRKLEGLLPDLNSYRQEIGENDEESIKVYKNIFSLIPPKILEEAKNPDGVYNSEKITLALKYISYFIERKVQGIDAKAVKADDKGGGGGKGRSK